MRNKRIEFDRKKLYNTEGRHKKRGTENNESASRVYGSKKKKKLLTGAIFL